MNRSALERLGRDLGDLLERHETARDLRQFERYREDPCAFAEKMLGVRLWPAQREMLEAVRDNRQTVVLGGQGVGKDYAGAAAALWWLYTREGALVLATAATQRQAVEVVHAEIVRLFKGAPDLPGEAFRQALRVPGGGGVVSFTSTESSKMTGFHGAHVLALASEAQASEPWAFEALRSCAVGADDRLVALANPLAPTGPVYTAARSGRWSVVTIPATSHPNIVERKVVIPGGPSSEWIEEMEATYGTASPIYRARVLAEWPDQGEESLFRRSWLDAAAERWERWHGEAEGEEPVLAVDVGRFGPDASVLAVLRGSVVMRLEEWSGADLMETVERVRAVAAEEGVVPCPGSRGVIVVDVVGLGAGVADRLVELGYAVAHFNGGSRASDPQRFANLRAESYWTVRDALELGVLALPEDEELAEELLAQTWTPTAEGRVALPPKETIKGQLGRSPNRADAVAMGVWWSVVSSAPVPSAEIVWDPAGLFSGPEDWAVT